ncbi:MAG: thioredoxin domain-containing protein [Parachlamydiales bacterium]|nr:thioredoxin domain-containing protein [Parachlamydiales bacterium]
MRFTKGLPWHVIITAILLVIVTVTFFMLKEVKLPPAIVLDTHEQPTIGFPNAPVHIVVFEEVKCEECRQFTQEIYPKIKKKYLDTQRIQYTVIPVSFIPGSMNAAESLICVYLQDRKYPNAELFFEYLDYIYKHQGNEQEDWATLSKIIEMAKATSPAIDLDMMKQCVIRDAFRTRIIKNTNYARALMGGKIATPAIFVNGILLKDISYDRLVDLIEAALQKTGTP